MKQKHTYIIITMIFSVLLSNPVADLMAQNANTTLSNLVSPTAVNKSLLPGSDNTLDLGSSSKAWKHIYFDGSIYMDGNRFLSNGDNTNNAFVGYNAGKYTTGTGNSFLGSYSGYLNTSGHDNTGIGYFALYNNDITYQNTAVGSLALFSLYGGYYNTAIGFSALFNNATGFYNTAVGTLALNETESSGNTAIGERAGALYENGWGCTFVGQQNWANANGYAYSTSLGYNSRITASYQARIGDATTTSIGGYASWTKISDSRVKKDVKQDVPGLAFINKLKPVTYHLDMNQIDAFMNPDKDKYPSRETAKEEALAQQAGYNAKSSILETGFLAQEVENAAKELGYDFSGVDIPKNEKDMYGLRYAEFVVPLVKAVQELSQQNDSMKKELEAVKMQLKALNSSPPQNGTGSSLPKQLSVESSSLNNPRLEQNVPNPFFDKTVIQFHLPATINKAEIKIASLSGTFVKSIPIALPDQKQITIDGGLLTAGNYTYTLIADGKVVDSRQMTLTR